MGMEFYHTHTLERTPTLNFIPAAIDHDTHEKVYEKREEREKRERERERRERGGS